MERVKETLHKKPNLSKKVLNKVFEILGYLPYSANILLVSIHLKVGNGTNVTCCSVCIGGSKHHIPIMLCTDSKDTGLYQ